MNFLPGDRVFVDESKAKGYIIVATAVATADQAHAVRELRGLLGRGQKRIHFSTERDSRRREILSRMARLKVRASVWVVKGQSEKVARPMCLEAATASLIDSGASELLLERDASVEKRDRQVIGRVVRGSGASNSAFRYRHCDPAEEPILWVSDAVAWCFQRRGEWLRRVAPLVSGRVTRL